MHTEEGKACDQLREKKVGKGGCESAEQLLNSNFLPAKSGETYRVEASNNGVDGEGIGDEIDGSEDVLSLRKRHPVDSHDHKNHLNGHAGHYHHHAKEQSGNHQYPENCF